MMKKILKWLGIGLGALIVLALAALGVLVLLANNKLDKTYPPPAAALAIPTDPASLEHGRHLVTSICAICHTDNLSGMVMIDGWGFMHLETANLTPGKGGAGAEFTDADYVKAIRYGLDPQNKTLLLMPAPSFYAFNDQDLGDIIAYLKSVPPVDKEVPEPSFGLFGKMALATGSLDSFLVAQSASQLGPRPAEPAPDVSAAYGAFLAKTHVCAGCHGAGLAGGKDPNPAAPPVPDITPSGAVSTWSLADFITAMRTGSLPSGKTLSDYMPWKQLGRMSDMELQALWLYLQSLPARPTGK